jgi:two-component system chemotaxis response regulator CheB
MVVTSDQRIRLLRGPRENHNRPAIDPLFRSAASAYGPRVIGVILSGVLDDGTAGLQAVKAAGGLAVVQEPVDATFPEPENALRGVDVDHRLPVRMMAGLVTQLTDEEVAVTPQDPAEDVMFTSAGVMGDGERGSEGEPAYSCPDCGGVLRERREGELVHYRCRVGHAYSPETLLALQSETVEEALWTAVRAMEEGAEVARRLARRARVQDRPGWAQKYEARVNDLRQSASVIRGVLENGSIERAATA